MKNDSAFKLVEQGSVYMAPSSAIIKTSQNSPTALRLLLAQRRFYGVAKRWSAFRAVGVGLIAITAPLVSFIWPTSSVVVGAIAGVWIVASRTVILTAERKLVHRAAVVQERFDLLVFGMPDFATRYPEVTPEEISRCVGTDQDVQASLAKEQLVDWYPLSESADGAISIAIAQRASAAYSEHLLRMNAQLWLSLVSLWSAAVVILSIYLQLSSVTFLLGVAAPLLPALLDVIDQWKATIQASGQRRQLANAIELAIRRTGIPIESLELIAWQDQLFLLRKESPLVPNLVYRRLRKKNEIAMEAAAAELANFAVNHNRGTLPQ